MQIYFIWLQLINEENPRDFFASTVNVCTLIHFMFYQAIWRGFSPIKFMLLSNLLSNPLASHIISRKNFVTLIQSQLARIFFVFLESFCHLSPSHQSCEVCLPSAGPMYWCQYFPSHTNYASYHCYLIKTLSYCSSVCVLFFPPSAS